VTGFVKVILGTIFGWASGGFLFSSWHLSIHPSAPNSCLCRFGPATFIF
jgi:hypothetical protein